MQIPAHDVAIMQKIVAKLKILSKHRDDEEAIESPMRARSSGKITNELDDATICIKVGHYENTPTSALQPYRK